MVTDFTVVGGGIAGMVAARQLALAGRSVRLLEASDRLGGTVSRQTVGGLELDAGAESFAVRNGTIAALAAELGLGNEVVAPAALGAWLQPRDGPAVRLPAVSMLGIPGAPFAADVAAVVGRSAAVRAQLDAILPTWWARRSLTVGELVRRRMGRRVLERLVAPVVHGVYSVHPDEVLLDRAMRGIREDLARTGSLAAAVRSLGGSAPPGSAVAGIRGGVHRIATELASELERLGVRVELGRRVVALDGLGGQVILAAPWGEARPKEIILATLVVDQPLLDGAPRGTGVLVARGAAGIRARALTHSTAKWDWLRERADGRHVVRLSYDDDPPELASVARADAAALLGVPLAASSVVDFARVKWVRYAASAETDGVISVGETVAGPGLAGIVAHTTRRIEELLVEG